MAGFGVWCLPLSAVAPIEDDYFLQVDSHGSKPLLMPSVNKWVTQDERLANVGEYIIPASAFGGCLPCPTAQDQGGTRERA